VTAGGGGWGDPLDRDPARVRADVIDEYISLAAAREVYGVVFKSDSRSASLLERRSLGEDSSGERAAANLDVDDEATARLRAEIRAARGVAGA
jgi:N-methylhydantoinase B